MPRKKRSHKEATSTDDIESDEDEIPNEIPSKKRKLNNNNNNNNQIKEAKQDEDDEEEPEIDEEEMEWRKKNEIDFRYYSLNELKGIINRCKIQLEFHENEDKNDVNTLRNKLRIFTRNHHLMVLTPQQVNNRLKNVVKVKSVKRVSNCFKAAVMQGFIPLYGENGESDRKSILKRVLYKGPCTCGYENKRVTIRIKDVLYQKDYGGNDYELWNDSDCEAPIKCPDGIDGCGKFFFIEMCGGPNHWGVEGGKFFNHCTKCPNFGICIGDYREGHCDDCNSHYYSCRGRFPCPTCNPDYDPMNF